MRARQTTGIIANKDAAAGKVHEIAPAADAHSQGISITGPLLFVVSFAAVAMFVAEAIFCLLWVLGGEYWTYVALLQ